MDRLTSMTIFRRVVELGSFSAAARELNLSVAAASKHVARLEERLGVRLLNRTTRRLSLTEAGGTYYEHARRLLIETEEMEQAVGQLQVAPRGVLRVNAPMSFGLGYVAPLVARFLEPYPELRIDLTLNDRYVDLIGEGVDLAIRIGEMADSTLLTRRLAPSRRCLVAAPAYLARHGTPRVLADLARHRCLIYAYQLTGDTWRFRTAFGDRDIPVAGPLRVNNGDATRLASLDGLGIALQPAFIVGPDIAAGRLVELHLEDGAPIPLDIRAVYPPSRFVPAKTRLFIEFLLDAYADAPWDALTGQTVAA